MSLPPQGIDGPIPGAEVESSLQALKRRVYLVGYGLAFLAASVAWLWNRPGGPAEAFNLLTLPVLAGLFLVLLVGLLLRPSLLRLTEVAAFVGTVVYMVARLCHALFVVARTTPVEGAIASFSHWLPAVMVLAFVIFEVRRAFVLSVAYHILLLALVGFYLLTHEESPVSVNILVQQFAFANAVYLVLFFVLATAREKYARFQALAEWWNHLAHTDSLTGAPNRRQLYQDLTKELARAERTGTPFSLILFDIDHFKVVNDEHGHPAGDEILRQVATVTRDQLRTNDLFGRWGGEEFMVVAPATDAEEAQVLAERLRTRLEARSFGEVQRVTASFGVATYHRGDTEADIVRRVDRALYQAKDAGRNRVVAAA